MGALSAISTSCSCRVYTIDQRTYFFQLLSSKDGGQSSCILEMLVTISSFTYTSLCGSGMLLSTALISCGPKPVKFRRCLGRLKPGPTGPCSGSVGGTPTEGRRSRGLVAAAAVAILVAEYFNWLFS